MLPSEAEGFGLVLIEAMAAGVPVVATDAPGIRDVVRHEDTGLLVPVADPPALAAAIDRVIADPALRHRLVDAALRAALRAARDRYAWAAVLPQYRQALAPPGKRIDVECPARRRPRLGITGTVPPGRSIPAWD